jgi:hypothetical protein
MRTYCEGCSYYWRPQAQLDAGPGVHKALVIAGSLSNAQRRTLKFESSGTFSGHPENECDITVNIGKKALLAFLYSEDRPMLTLDTWRGKSDVASCAEQMTPHHYTFNVLAIDEPTDKEIQRRGDEKLYGIPTYIIQHGTMYLREFDPDGSEVKFDIPRIS